MQNNKKSDSINILDLLMYLISKWKWFLVSVVVCVGAAWLVYSGKPFVYFTSSTVIIKDPSNKTSSAGLDRYDNFINRVNVANEILQFQSKKLITEVVQRVRADVSYKVKDHLRYRELYTQSPVAVSFPDATPARNIALTVIPFNDDVVKIVMPLDRKRDTTIMAGFADTVTLALGEKAVITPTNYYGPSWKGREIYVTKRPLESVVAYYRANFGIRQEEEESSILRLSLKDESPSILAEVASLYGLKP